MSWQPGQTLKDLEKKAILRAYQWFDQNKTHTASALGISLTTLREKLDIYADEDATEKLYQEQARKSTRSGFEIGHANTRHHEIAGQRLPVESAVEVSEEPAVSVQERSEVQEMLPEQNRESDSRPQDDGAIHKSHGKRSNRIRAKSA